MKKDTLAFIAFLLFVLSLGIYIFPTLYQVLKKENETFQQEQKVYKDTIWVVDTVKDIRLIPIKTWMLWTDTVLLEKNDTLYPEIITLKKKQYNYIDDYIKVDAEVTGYSLGNDTLPSLTFNQVTKNIPTVIEKEVITKKKKWTYGPSVGIGYGMTSNKPDIYLGFSVAYSL